MPEEILETPQTAESVETKSTNWPRISLAAIFGFALLFAAAYAGYWYGTGGAKVKEQSAKPTPVVSQPTSKPTPTATLMPASETANAPAVKAGWKLYRDERVGYSLQYPSPWFLSDETVELGGGEPLEQKTTQILWITTHEDMPSYQVGDLGAGDDVRLGVNYIENEEGVNLREQMRKHVRPDFADNPPENITSSWITLDGLDAHRYVYYPGNKWGSPGVYTTIQLENGDFLKVVSIILHDFDSYLDQVIEIENSFRTL